MKPYELLEHTADAKFRARGATLEEAFANSVKGLVAIATDPAGIDLLRETTLSVEAVTLEALLFDFLDQIIFLIDTQGMLPGEAEVFIAKDGAYTLSATLRGDDARKYGSNLKAVTYSEMLVEKQKDGSWLLQAVIDI